MGTVYLAVREEDEFRKQVAIKVLRRGMDTDAIIQRFRHERQILAGLVSDAGGGASHALTISARTAHHPTSRLPSSPTSGGTI